MKMIKKASGKTVVKISKEEWEQMGEQTGWIKGAGNRPDGVLADNTPRVIQMFESSLLPQMFSEIKGSLNENMKQELNQAVRNISNILQKYKK